MRSTSRVALSILLVAVGAFTTLFFVALVGFADCGARCESTGERAPAIAIAAAGVGLVVAGVRLRHGARAAWILALIVTGALTALGATAALATGEAGWMWGALAAGVGSAAGGLWLRRRATA